MCVVSFVGEHYSDKFKDYDWLRPYIQPNIPPAPTTPVSPWQLPHIEPIKQGQDFADWWKDYMTPHQPPTRQEYDELQKKFEKLQEEVKEMKVLLEKAMDYDKRNNEPNCEVEEKIAMLKHVAKLVGVDLETLFKTQ